LRSVFVFAIMLVMRYGPTDSTSPRYCDRTANRPVSAHAPHCYPTPQALPQHRLQAMVHA
jgi:hypothetical protein